ncbi:MAG: GBS Bsp-like repeat-containing protein [Lachnospiraceae bacterium]|nr:GBS Bsp-like repeat-containing protein [Lachnospiraceae bacterium]
MKKRPSPFPPQKGQRGNPSAKTAAIALSLMLAASSAAVYAEETEPADAAYRSLTVSSAEEFAPDSVSGDSAAATEDFSQEGTSDQILPTDTGSEDDGSESDQTSVEHTDSEDLLEDSHSDETEEIHSPETVAEHADTDSENEPQEITEETAEETISISVEDGKRILTVRPESSYRTVRYAVWSKTNGQDDIIWHRLKKNEEGNWTGAVDLSSLKHSGDAYIHIYADEKTFIGDQVITVDEEELSVNRITISGTGGTRTVNVRTTEELADLRAAVWSAKGGQDDIKWYSLRKEGENWIGFIDFKNLKHAGTCYVHFYTGKNTFVGSETFTASEDELPQDQFSVTGNGNTRSAQAVINSSAGSVRVAIWSKTKVQDDLKWYTLKKQSDGSWSGTVNCRMIKHSGSCYAHFYADKNTLIGTASFTVSDDDINGNQVSVTGSGTSRKAVAEMGESVSGISVAVWSASGGQDDLKWYTLKKGSDNTWTASIDIAMLAHSGTCFAHFYAAGNRFIGDAVFSVTADQIAKKSISVTDQNLTKKVTVTSPGRSDVTIAVWSATGGQDDISWYTLRAVNSGTWSISVPLYRLKHSGTVHIHAYANGNSQFLGGITTTVSASQISSSASISGSGSNIDFIQWAMNIAANDSIGYGHTYPKTISCAGLVGLGLTYCGYGDFIKNDPLGWGYIDLGAEYENELINGVGCSVRSGAWTASRVNELKPGDILYYYHNINSNHVAIYIGNGMTVEARGPYGVNDYDSSGAEVAVYHWTDALVYQKVFRIPESKLHYTS